VKSSSALEMSMEGKVEEDGSSGRMPELDANAGKFIFKRKHTLTYR
jgi:hypothetical protein